jgi:phosphohistidine phosphatase
VQRRRLVLVRHAEAGSAVADAERQLTERGGREAVAVGRWLAGVGVVADRVVVSPARRARQTWDRAAEALPSAPRPLLDERLYENTPDSALLVVRETPEDVGTLVVVGHNPSVGRLAHALGGEPGDPDAGRRLESGFPPGAAAVFELGVPFEEVEPGGATLLDARVPSG